MKAQVVKFEEVAKTATWDMILTYYTLNHRVVANIFFEQNDVQVKHAGTNEWGYSLAYCKNILFYDIFEKPLCFKDTERIKSVTLL